LFIVLKTFKEMNFAQVLFLGVMVCAMGDDSCPEPDKIAPCTCDGEGLNCMLAKSIADLKRAFGANFKYGGVRSVWVQGTPITSLPKDAFGNQVQSQQFYIEVNNISNVDFDAFSTSKETLRTLSLFGNLLDHLNYSPLKQYPNLALLNLARNRITGIPENTFHVTNLQTLLLAQNKIAYIGSNAFRGLPNLVVLDLSQNVLTTLGPASLALTSQSFFIQISLARNKISTVSDTFFNGTEPYVLSLSQNKFFSLPYNTFGNLITVMARKGGFIEVHDNPFTCKGCDYSWIVLNKDLLTTKFVGFMCSDGRSLSQLTKTNINCDQ